jgi:hypothetical protein
MLPLLATLVLTAFGGSATIGTAINLHTASTDEAVVITGVSSNSTFVGWTCTPVKSAYTTAITFQLAAGATTGSISVAAVNACAMIASVVSRLSTSSFTNGLRPF